MRSCSGCPGNGWATRRSSRCCSAIAACADGAQARAPARSRLVIADEHLDNLDPEQLRQALRAMRVEVALKDELLARRTHEVAFKQAVIDKLTHENAVLKRLKFAAKSEAYTADENSLSEGTLEMDRAAVAAESEALQPKSKPTHSKEQPKRAPRPPHLPRREIRHEPESTTSRCGTPMQRIGED